MHFFYSKEQLFHLLGQEVTVLTPNNRLSEALLQHYLTHTSSHTLSKPRCMPYRLALIKAYEALHFMRPSLNPPTLLNNAQCHSMWRKIIQSQANSTYSEGLLQS